jgi:4-amino-4-deoxy-L-arabinose transferase-like glycosyltransferase
MLAQVRQRYLIAPVLALAACLYLWALSRNGVGNAYYAAAVKSMAESWNAFLFASLDPSSFITVDKPPLAFWPLAILARIFGFGPWTVLLPQALEGVLTVFVLWRIVARRFGDSAGLVAALALTVTPIMVATSRVNLPDSLLALLLVCAAWATLRGAEAARVRWLVVAGAFVGAAFATKTIAAFLLLPALTLGYWIVSSASRRQRLTGLAAGGASTFACSLPWVLLVALTPASDRPWIGGSDENTALGLALSRTGFDTFGPIGVDGFRPPGFGQSPGVTRLFNEELAGQDSWFLALAATGAVIAALSAWRVRDRGRLGAVVLFAVWMVVHAAVFSFATGVFHAYYLVALAPAVAALVGAGIVSAVELAHSGRRGQAIVAAVLSVGVLSQLVILGRTSSYLEWLRPTVIAIAAVGLVLLAVGAIRRAAGPVRIGVLVAAAGLFVAPVAWAIDASGQREFGSIPVAGPELQFAGRGFVPVTTDGLASYLRAHRDRERWDVALVDGIGAAPLILDGIRVAALGGFLGVDPAGTPASVGKLVQNGKLRFVLAVGPAFGFSVSSAPAVETVNEVRSACRPADLGRWAESGEGPPPENPFTADWRGVLYDCKGVRLGA